jgi:hypothetical protein
VSAIVGSLPLASTRLLLFVPGTAVPPLIVLTKASDAPLGVLAKIEFETLKGHTRRIAHPNNHCIA